MNKYDTSKINAINIRDVASKLNIEVKKHNTVYLAHCLWHQDSHQSMQVGSVKDGYNFCHCYACGCTHGVIDLVMAQNNMDFKEACEWIEQAFYNVDVLTDEYKRASSNSPQKGEIYKMKDKRNKAIVRKTHKEKPPPTPPKEGCLKPVVSMEQNKGDRYRSSFARCLTEVFGEEKMRDVVETYYLSAWKAHGRYDDVLFPSIDIRDVCRDLKAQGYDCDTRSERFFHRLDKVCYWIGNIIYPDAIFDRNCLFGEHLLGMYPEKTVILVESPKNACVGYAQYPQYVWVAVGNKAMLNRSVLEVLRGRKVVVFPDNDAFEEWSSKLEAMQDIASFYCMEAPGATGNKGDIADWIISRRLVSRRLSVKC